MVESGQFLDKVADDGCMFPRCKVPDVLMISATAMLMTV